METSTYQFFGFSYEMLVKVVVPVCDVGYSWLNARIERQALVEQLQWLTDSGRLPIPVFIRAEF